MDNEQFFERFRNLSRDIQHNIQRLQARLGNLADNNDLLELASAVEESWQDFSGWVTLSTLDDDEKLLDNCAPGFLSIQSKIVRLTKRSHRHCSPKRLTMRDTHNYKTNGDLKIQTYIQYFEQLLDLVANNSIKYAPPSDQIEIDWSLMAGSNLVKIVFSSSGPSIGLDEKTKLGDKGFRSRNALLTKVSGSGYGLYNVKRLVKLLKGSVAFRVGQQAYELNKVPYGKFEVEVTLPVDIESVQ